MKKENNKERTEPELLPVNDLLKPKGSPYLWLGLALLPILLFIVAELRREKAPAEGAVATTQTDSYSVQRLKQDPMINEIKRSRTMQER